MGENVGNRCTNGLCIRVPRHHAYSTNMDPERINDRRPLEHGTCNITDAVCKGNTYDLRETGSDATRCLPAVEIG
jgi:hypothetical protein